MQQLVCLYRVDQVARLGIYVHVTTKPWHETKIRETRKTLS